MLVAAALGLALAAGVTWLVLDPGVNPETRVVTPALSDVARAGKAVFDAKCAGCHGPNAAGSGQGPPLVHRTYHPGHHADAAFALAVRRGVRAHHWRFGDMPPQPSVTEAELQSVTAYVRELQRANGIY